MLAGKPMLGCLAGLAMKLPTGLEANGSLKLADKAEPDATVEGVLTWVGVLLAGAGVTAAGAGVGAAGRMGLSGSIGVLPGAKPIRTPLMPAPRHVLMSSTCAQLTLAVAKDKLMSEKSSAL